ncbi:MAG: tetratricopeptide repeat protein [Bacteroidetes bacterium]|nr:tetratricopeptide repeat protein [Bacteroidota bacterium]
MSKSQWTLISVAILLFAILYFGFDTKPSKQKAVEKQRAGAFSSTDINSMLVDAKASLSTQAAASVMALEGDVEKASPDSAKAESYKQLSSFWYQLEKPGIAGYYAEKVAEITREEEAWSIAGTTYSLCVQREQEDKIKSFCTEHAVQALEKAASLNPSNIQHKVNLALVYTENPPKETPMKGILMLVDLNKQYPDDVLVLTQLGRLAIKTGQFDRAVQRLSRVVELEPDNKAATCLLAQAYEGMGESAKAADLKSKCEKLSGN